MDLINPPNRALLRSLRSAKPIRDPDVSQGYVMEQEPVGCGRTVRSATYFLTGSECRFTCSYCDLWKYTIDAQTPRGSLVRQIQALHDASQSAREGVEWLKLYNAANFFDPYNVPAEDYAAIASSCDSFARVVVENHAALTSTRQGQSKIRSFQSMLQPELEVAMGLETIDPDAMRLMNKSTRLEEFDRACETLLQFGISIRVFVILQPPGTRIDSSLDWAVESCRYAFRRGAQRCSILPARRGNGWIDQLEREGAWIPPDLTLVESTMRAALDAGTSTDQIVTIDLWDWELLAGGCDACRPSRRNRLMTMNLEQRTVSQDFCAVCDPTGAPH